ncbi:MAG: type VI secretion system tube protein Hcp [Inquilinus sp.]|nr:type VI secretion system tube protein Hcp [Inquilinus sp.]
MAIYLKLEGIDGNATHADHKKWIGVDSLQWGVGRAVSTHTGRAANREASQPSVSEVTMSKEMDMSSPHLFNEACVGHKGKKAEIHLVSTGSPGETYLAYTLTDALVTGYSCSSGGDRPTESISLNFTKLEMKYVPLAENNEPGSPVTKGYDLVESKAV